VRGDHSNGQGNWDILGDVIPRAETNFATPETGDDESSGGAGVVASTVSKNPARRYCTIPVKDHGF
jgi:hypothetical protein